MNSQTVKQMVPGPAGALECAIDLPANAPLGTMVLCHPHPQQAGTMDNKVVQTLARATLQLGWRSVRFNYRGVGASEGAWDNGVGEVDDALAVIAAFTAADATNATNAMNADPHFMLGGFSFGAYVAAQAAARLIEVAKPQRMVLVGPSTARQTMAAVPADSVVVHGEIDDVVPLAATLAWARPQSLPVIVLPGVGHFFHGQLGLLKSVVVRELQPRASL